MTYHKPGPVGGREPDPVTVAVDVMGGDHAPQAPVAGALAAVGADPGLSVLLVGDQERIAPLLPAAHPRVRVMHAPDIIRMDEAPVRAVRQKPRSSLVRVMELVKSGEAQAAVSAGHTGALMAAGLFALGPLPGVDRPALSALLPGPGGRGILLLDAGAHMNPRAYQLVRYAYLGANYMEAVFELERPRVGLLNVGEEAGKGPAELREAHRRLLRAAEGGAPFVFTGNLEGRDILSGRVDVVVTDGFTGNVMLKFLEGMARDFRGMLEQAIRRNPVTLLGGLLLRPGLRPLARTMDYQRHGGAPLLGLDGLVYKCHGSSREIAFAVTLARAATYVRQRAQDRIRARIGAIADGEERADG
ncbi:phosphate:acyl-ACP acyltransferase [Candidatus Hydrogenisulfobacillus filiaventi]|uniref:Phosphate acyltransferase n=1 Tax=Candidatus Hydrogenisulfobacillus filiaventi TaxID=2707344 RepID=A0A6F8ZH55_9FIRM|nr:phosphate acyltransferase PlsX [Bacillota bacterium]CAB1129116.1 phosphate:acyl-ACP acyltransferase [Candidatus Hydrogenisulfobacillus filiaventi]